MSSQEGGECYRGGEAQPHLQFAWQCGNSSDSQAAHYQIDEWELIECFRLRYLVNSPGAG